MKKVILGVSQKDFYNFKLFEKVSLMRDFPIKVYCEGKCEYLGVEVKLDKNGKATQKEMAKALSLFANNAFDRLKEISPVFYTLEV